LKTFADLALVNEHIKNPLFADIEEFVSPTVGLNGSKTTGGASTTLK